MKTINFFKTGAVVLSLSVLTFSCNNTTNETTTQEATETEAPPTENAAPAINDAQIASIAVTANQIDIDYANIALNKASNAEVKKFAQAMAKDHQSVIDQAVALATKLGVTPEDNATTQSLLDGKTKTVDLLNSKSGADFDKAYVDNEVEYHKFAINAVENTLIPNCQNEELKALLQTALPLFKTHLEHAEMVQAALNK